MRRTLLRIAAAVALCLVVDFAVPEAKAVGNFSKVVGYGDSYAAGTGVSDASGPCLTSSSAYPTVLGGAAAINQACSGAVTGSIAGQISAVGAPSNAAATSVTLTIGGNDVGFSNVMTSCIGPFAFLTCSSAISKAKSAIGTLTPKVAAQIDAVRAAAPTARIYVTGYPKLFGSFSTSTCSVGNGLSITKSNAGTIDTATGAKGASGTLNNAIYQATVGRSNVVYVELSSFVGHQVCNYPKGRWINPVMSVTSQSFHPNAAGEAAYAQAIAGAA